MNSLQSHVQALFDNQPVAIKLIDVKSWLDEITKAWQEVAVYRYLKDLHEKHIPFLYWHGYLFDEAYYALVLTLIPMLVAAQKKRWRVYSAFSMSKDESDARPENFVRSSTPQQKLMPIDLGQSDIECQDLNRS